MSGAAKDEHVATRQHGGALRVVMRAAVPPSARRALHGARSVLATAHDRAFERRYDIDIRGTVYLEDLGLSSEERVFYHAIGWLPLRRALTALRPAPDDVFADLGAGKGAALVTAATFPFARVVGVETAEALAAVARRNVERARPRLRARDVEVVTADAQEWEVPDDLSILFLYCPFTGALFRRVIERVTASYDRRPRRLHLLYAFPAEHNWLLSTGRLEVVDVRPAEWPSPPWWPWSGWVIATYRFTSGAQRSVPPPRGSPVRRAAHARWRGPNDQPFGLLQRDVAG